METSRQIEQEIERLEVDRDQAILAERAEYERQLQAKKEAEAEEQRRKEEAIKRLPAELEARHRRDIERDLEWWPKVKAGCFTEAMDPLFRSWGLCQAFLAEQRQDQFCSQCDRGYLNPHFKAGQVHKERAREPR
ncbi:hypothetical protein ES703_28618 [subsurface metagenome]